MMTLQAARHALVQNLGLDVRKAAPGTLEFDLGEACRKGDLAAVQKFLDSGLSVETHDSNGRPLLNAAAQQGHANIAEELIKRGADVNAKCTAINFEGLHFKSTALHASANGGNYKVAELLLKAGADPNAALEVEGIFSQFQIFTPLHMAASRNHTSVMRLLMSHGADPTVGAIMRFKGIPRPYFSGITALHMAAFTHQIGAIELLLTEAEMDPNLADKETGATPLHAACGLGDTDAFPMLVAAGANLNAKMIGPDGNGLTPLHVACMFGRVNAIASLLQLGADPTITNDDGVAAIQMVPDPSMAGHVQALMERFKQLKDVNFFAGKNEEGQGRISSGSGGGEGRPQYKLKANTIREVDLAEMESVLAGILSGNSR